VARGHSLRLGDDAGINSRRALHQNEGGSFRMVPGWVPWPQAVVCFTGVCELAGALGLLVPSLRLAAGIALIAFFVLVFILAPA
jgi:uncharacterized membrane protein